MAPPSHCRDTGGLILDRPFQHRQGVCLMKRRVSLLAAIASLLFAAVQQPRAISNSVVISQIYGGGGNSGSTYKNDFIELFNRSASPVDVTGMSVQYASAAGTTWQVTNLSGTIAPGGYYLVQEAVGHGRHDEPADTGRHGHDRDVRRPPERSRSSATRPRLPAPARSAGRSSTSSGSARPPTASKPLPRRCCRTRQRRSEPPTAAPRPTTTPPTSPSSRRSRATARRRPPHAAARRTHRALAPRAPRLCSRGNRRCSP